MRKIANFLGYQFIMKDTFISAMSENETILHRNISSIAARLGYADVTPLRLVRRDGSLRQEQPRGGLQPLAI